jgi:hypothetical protein
MSIDAISWALNKAPIPRNRRDASSLAIVLVGLADHADPNGRNAFPAIARLARYTRLSERAVQYAIRTLEQLGLIRPSDPQIVAAYIKRADRRPKGWDLVIHRVIHNDEDEVQTVHPVHQRGVQTQPDGVQTTTSRGASSAPEPSFNRPKNRTPREHAPQRARAAAVPPVCGQCDARDSEPISARVVWLDADRTRSHRCPRCHPRLLGERGAA